MLAAKRIAYIDGLRAIAVLSVLVYHASENSVLGPWLFVGRHGVDLFFVISGFCLAFPTLYRYHQGMPVNFDLAGFFSKRILRIVPPYWMATGVFILLTNILLYTGLPYPISIIALQPFDMFKQLFFLDYNLNFSNGSFWTLVVEFRWYLIFPLLLLLWVKNPRAFGLVMFVSFCLYHFTRIRAIDLATLPVFMSGIIAADILMRGDKRGRIALWLVIPAIALSLLLDRHWGHVLQDTVWWQATAFFLVVGAGSSVVFQRILAWKPIVFIGLASYSIYLYHEPIAGVLTYDLHWNWVLAAGIALIVGIVAYFLIERPLQLPQERTIWVNRLKPRLARFFDWARLSSITISAVRLVVVSDAVPLVLEEQQSSVD